ncbi:response regulator [Conexibacter sp. SYSU D00693]|uniref:response regulator n=1 Tax=Conexibacter sp. SYSU D00693 TaxID=2812560 RepID=UPI00196A9471|nr:response regulator [Conexibacter sp. SYSU D00693]
MGALVLVVDDHDVNRVVLERLVARLGHRCLGARGGEEALALLEDEPVDLVLMDCEMPGLDGFAATAQLRRREAGYGDGSHVPVVALTGHADDEERTRAREAGMDDFVVKPLAADRLAALLERWAPGDVEVTIDEARLTALVGDFDAAAAAEIVGTFLRSTPEQVDLVRTAVAAGDGPAAASASHRLKGGCLAIGAAALAQACAVLEAEGRDGASAARLADLGAAVVTAWDRTEPELRRRMPDA